MTYYYEDIRAVQQLSMQYIAMRRMVESFQQIDTATVMLQTGREVTFVGPRCVVSSRPNGTVTMPLRFDLFLRNAGDISFPASVEIETNTLTPPGSWRILDKTPFEAIIDIHASNGRKPAYCASAIR